ncbi:DsbA family protein [Tranquillimonas alkanivorans]|uniref:Protein-disulfide isomerase n=1 Tax=Tranquillimonas alkanivorans TaxID=441119 RepID=A0A1I5U8P7_9RHOB|nr:thioredoxin domain-containing protein [Tranquillimonas alkanivorans]SFP91653.1 Protein-disulfide isomerase [Tranquillimonas alkanivorans]
MTRRHLLLAVLAVAVAIFAAASWIVTRPAPQAMSVAAETAEILVRPHSPVLGTEDAPVTIVEFFDPACESCRAFYPIVKDIMAEHGDAVRVVIRYTPFHGDVSEQAIKVLEAARAQGVFEPVLQALMETQPEWASHADPAPDLILPIVAEAGLDPDEAKAQLLSPMVLGILNQDRADVQAIGVRATPTFFVNERPLASFGEAQLRDLVAAEVRAAGS